MSSSFYATPLALSQGFLFWTLGILALVGAGLLSPFGVRWLFGPVPFYDLIRVARKRRYYLIRFLYILGLLLFLLWVYALWWNSVSYRSQGTPSVNDMAELANVFFYTFMGIQAVVVGVLTPAYVAGAIADEKDRRTLEFLLATDLRSREIVLGKLVARVANIVLLLLAGLPILSFTQFFGGIDPDLLLAAYAALVVSTFSLAGLSILASVYSKKARDAIVLTYLAATVYLAVSALGFGACKAWPEVGQFPSEYLRATPVTLTDVAEWVSSGNTFIALMHLVEAFERGRSLAEVLPEVLRNYALFHGVLGSLCILLAVLRLRPVALKETYGKVRRVPLAARVLGRPPVGNQPMIWKEIVTEPGLRFNWFGLILILVVVAISFSPLIVIWNDFSDYLRNPGRYGYYYGSNPWERLSESVNAYVRAVGAIVATLVLLGIAVRASSAISGERDRQTLDSLLTTPLSGNEILLGKWLGCICGFRFAWLWLGAILAIGIVAGAIHPLAVPLVALAFVVYSVVFAGIGLLFSMRCRTSLRATLWTLMTVVFVGGGHWLVMGLCCFMPLAIGTRGNSDALEWLAKLELGQTPLGVLAILAFEGREFTTEYGGKQMSEMTACCLFGVFTWAVAALGLWAMASARFNALTNRGQGISGDITLDRYSRPAMDLAQPPVMDAIPLDEGPPPAARPWNPS